MATKEQKQAICNEYRDILECIYYVGRGVMPSYYLKQYTAHFRGKSEVTVWRYIKKLEDVKLVSQVKKFDCWFVKLGKFAVAYIENKEPSTIKSVGTDGELLRLSIYISARLLPSAKAYSNVDTFVANYQKSTTLLATQKTVSNILNSFPSSGYLQIEQRRLADKTTSKINTLNTQRKKSITTRKTHAVVRKAALEQLKKDNVTLTKDQRKRFIMDKIEDDRLAKIKANRNILLKQVNVQEREKVFGLDNMLSRHIYIENLQIKSKEIHIAFIDVSRRCDVARMKEDIEAVHNMFLRTLGNNHGFKINITVYCQSHSRRNTLIKNQKVVNDWLISEHRKLGEYQNYKIISMNIDKKLYGGTKVLSL